jgi:ABC-type multidrug transport system ATPase subunit
MVHLDQVQLVDVSRHFGRRRAVSRVTLTVSRGDLLALVGPNGAGKSTLLGMLATLISPTSGTIRYDGHDARSLGAGLRARIGLLAHDLHLYAELSARQNLALFARLYGLDAGTIVESALQTAGLSDRADEDVGKYSRGMRQRLAIERALLHRPGLVLLDEPFTGLDDSAARLVTERLRALAADGAIVLLATHDLEVAADLASRVAVVVGGRLIADEPGGPDLRRRYRTVVGTA